MQALWPKAGGSHALNRELWPEAVQRVGCSPKSNGIISRRSGVAYDPYILDSYEQPVPADPIPDQAFQHSPLRIFLRLENSNHNEHNVEQLFKHAWKVFGSSHELWEDLVYDGVYFRMFFLTTEQFGFGPAENIRELKAGKAVAECLFADDRVINLNYDIIFDLSLQQARKYFDYSPAPTRDCIYVYKPHGSFNLYSNIRTGDCFFCDPSDVPGSVSIRDTDDHFWSQTIAIVPPRVDKTYNEYPIASMILSGIEEFKPQVLTFWGVGLTQSDIDLIEIYRNVLRSTSQVEFINPSEDALTNAKKLLGVDPIWYPQLDQWLEIQRR